MSVDGKSKPAVGVNRNQDTSPNSSQADQDRGGNVSFSPLTSSNFNERIYENVKFHQKRNRKKSKPHSRHDNPESIKPPEIPLCTPEICVENIDELQVEELPNQPIEIVTIEELQDEAAVCTVTAYVTPSPQYCTRECLSLSREKLLNMKEGDRHLKSKIPVKRTQKKLKRIAVEDYFFPMLRSPVYLDVINEETSSLSNEEDDTLTLTQPCTSYQSTTLPVPWKTRQEQEFEEQQEREREEDEEFEEIVQEEIGIEDKSEDEEREDSNRINNDLAYPTTLAILTENKIELVPITKDVPEENDTNEHIEPVTPPTDTLNPKDRQSRSPSFGSCCSSRSSSIVTAINVGNNYNPHSSVGNMEQFLAGLERPGTLRELCLNRLLSLPFGKEVLQELAEVSQNLQGLTEKLSEYAQQYQYQSPNLTEQPNVVNNNNNNNNNYLEDSKEDQSAEYSEDRTCSSKSEQEYDEWIKSFIRHHKNIIDSKVSSAVEEVKFSNASVSSDYKDSDKNRLLDIILAESDCQAMNDSKETKDVSTGDLLTNITSEITKNTTTVISTSSEDSLVNLNNSPKKELKENDSVTRNNLYNPKFSAQSGSNIELEMTYLLIKEKQIQKELEKLEEEKRKIYAELSSEECSSCSMNINKTPEMDKLSKEPQHQAMTEFFRQKMFDEYMKKIAERESRLQHKIIKVSSGSNFLDAALNEEGKTDVVHVKKLEEEFLERVKEKRKHGKLVDDDEEDSRDSSGLVSDADVSENDEESPMLVLDGISVEHESSLPSHLKEFLALAKNAPVTAGVWSPTQTQDNTRKGVPHLTSQGCPRTEPPPSPPPPPVWTPQSSPVLERKFKPISFSSPKSVRRHTFIKSDEKPDPNKERITSTPVETVFAKSNSDSNIRALTAKFDSNYTPRLPKVQNPTVVLLRTARENQLSKNARENAAKPPPAQLNQANTAPAPAPPPPPPLFNGITTKEPPPSPSKQEPALRISPFFPREFNGIGPTTKDGMPLILRSEIKNEDQSRWYKKMYDTIHKPRKINDEYVTIRYKQRRPQYPYISGYLSEPGSLSYDSDMDERVQWPPGPKQSPQVARYTTTGKTAPATLPRTLPPSKPWSSYSDIVEPTHKNQPKSIANYHPGKSSITGKETEKWWDEVMNIFNGLEKDRPNNHARSKPNLSLKESGYDSDSTLVFHRKEEPPRLAPAEQKEAYITIQKGGDVPFSGLRKPAPEKPTNLLDIEYFLSPIHMKAPPHNDIVCYPVTLEHNSRPPSPPKRKSSHNNKTLRLISLMKLRGSKASNKRHEVCFMNTTNLDQDNKVKYLKDKITYKLYPQKKKPSERIVPCTRVKPSSAAPKTTNLSRSKDSATASKEGKSNPGPGVKGIKKEASPAKKLLLKTKERKSDVEKKKVLGSKQPKTITFSNLKSKKVEEFSDDNNGLLQKKSLTTFSSVKNGAKNVSETALPITVKISQNGQKILKTSFISRKAPEITIVKTRKSPKSTHSSIDEKSIHRIKTPKKESKIMDNQPSLMDMDLHEIKFNQQFLEDIQKQREKIQSNFFYQHLLLQNYPSSYPLITKNNFLDTETFKKSEPTVGAMQFYLQHTRPVSDSRFRTLDLRSRSSSPKSVRFVSGESHARSSSLPGTMYFSQTTRPVSPMVPRRPLPLSYLPDSPIISPNTSPVARRKSRMTEASPPKIIFTQTSRPVSPCITRRARSAGSGREEYPNVKDIKRESKLFFSETNRPVSPLSVYRPMRLEVLNKDLPKMIFSETRRPVSPSASPRLSRRSRGDDERGDIGFVRYVPSKLSLLETGSTRRSKSNEEKFVTTKQSDNGIDGSNRKAPTKLIFTETSRPVSPIIPSHKRRSRSNEDAKTTPKSNPICVHVRGFDKTCRYCQSIKFRDLTDFYSDIERVARLEKSTSTSDLKLRKRTEEEIIDFDRWKEVRTRERAEKELDNLYSHLRDKERDLGFLFRCKQKDTKWRKEYDRGLRIKEKSVDDIKDEFERLKINLRKKNDYEQRDTYKPLWRGNSVTNIVSTISERRSRSEGRTTSTSKAFRDSEKMLTHGIGSRIWSSLSMEQVNLLKEQLQEIYDHKYKKQEAVSLTFPITRSHSQKNGMFSPCNSDISEVDKRRLSQDISREVLTKFKTGKDKNNENLKIKDKIKNTNNNNNTKKTITTKETKKVETTTTSTSVTTDNNYKTSGSNQVITPLIKTSAISPPMLITSSENESEKTDDSTHTIIPKSNKIIEEKVEYFEKLSIERPYTPTIYKPADDPEVEDAPKRNKLGNSSSYQDLKELFGEQESPKYSSPIPFQAPVSNNYCSSPVLHSMDGSISEIASTDSLGRSQSLSPYLEKPTTDSCRLSEDEKFSSIETHRLHHSKSDSYLNRHSDIFFTDGSLVSVDFLKRKFENLIRYGRSRYRKGGVVSPLFLRAKDRLMPHINIISKIARLYTRNYSHNKRGTQNQALEFGIPAGEVEKLKEKFDGSKDISLLGEMYTSSPDLKELRRISPYLSAGWIAHRYPRLEDNTRSLSCPEKHATEEIRPPKKTAPKRILRTSQNSRLHHHGCPAKEKYRKSDVNGKTKKFEGQPRQYVERDVTIHYRTPVRQEVKEMVGEEELAHRQAEAMRRLYQEESQRKRLQVSNSLQELKDMHSRRHTDNFMPSQKSPIPLDRYEHLPDFPVARIPRGPPEPHLVARALFNFVGQTSRELTFRKGDLIRLRRQVDNNWYEGECNAMTGLFPVNYVEILPYTEVKSAPSKKTFEGQARAKYNFTAQTQLELSLSKGELVTITRRVDNNWFEGKIGGRKGIFPVSYVEVLTDPGSPTIPNLCLPPVSIPAKVPVSKNARPERVADGSLDNGIKFAERRPLNQTLHIETQSETTPYRALFKYLPQNEDELELIEGDVVYVLEKCDDGWYVGSSERTGAFGTFPGNYVHKI